MVTFIACFSKNNFSSFLSFLLEINGLMLQYSYLAGSGGPSSVSGDGGIESTFAYPPPQHEPSNGERSLALQELKSKDEFIR